MNAGCLNRGTRARLTADSMQEPTAVPLNGPDVTLAPLARPVFAWNHHGVMRAGGEGLARRLGVRLVEAGSAEP